MNKVDQIKELKMLLETGAIDESQYSVLLNEIVGGKPQVEEKTEKFESAVKNDFDSVIIDNQAWMIKNLNIKNFRNGDPIKEASNEEKWEEALTTETPAWCYYDDDPINGDEYGLLYNYFAINDKRGLAPDGWGIPDEKDFKNLTKQLDGRSLRSRSGWSFYEEITEIDIADEETYKYQASSGGNGTNKSGFNLKSGGFYSSGRHIDLGHSGILWIKDSLSKFISSQDLHSSIERKVKDYEECFEFSYQHPPFINLTNSGGFNVRCIKKDAEIILKDEEIFNSNDNNILSSFTPETIEKLSLTNNVQRVKDESFYPKDITEVKIISLLKKVGDIIKEGDILAEIETDKVSIEVCSLYSGKIIYIGVEEEQIVPINNILVILDSEISSNNKTVSDDDLTLKELLEKNVNEISDLNINNAERLVAEYGLYDPRLDLSDYKSPNLELLQEVSSEEGINLKSLFSSPQFQNTEMELPIVLGKMANNEVFVIDLLKNKNTIIFYDDYRVNLDDTILISLLFKKHPAEIKFILCTSDFISQESDFYNRYDKIENHFLVKLPISTRNSSKFTVIKKTLEGLSLEKDERDSLIRNAGVKNINEYNNLFKKRKLNTENGHRFLPYLIIFIKDYEELLYQIGKSSDLLGIYIIYSTDIWSYNRLSRDFFDIFNTKICFKLRNANRNKDFFEKKAFSLPENKILYSFKNENLTLKFPIYDDLELSRTCNFISKQRAYPSPYLFPEVKKYEISDIDSLFREAAEIIITAQQGSPSLLQRKLKVGYNRAGRLIDQLEAAGIVGPFETGATRNVNIPNLKALDNFLNDKESKLGKKKDVTETTIEQEKIKENKTLANKIFNSIFNKK